jgi:hypothetical protein
MSHPYLLLSDSTNYPGKLLVGQSATSGSYGCGLTDTNVKVIEIPSTFNGKEVVEIGYCSFHSAGIASVFIPRTILCIYYAAFNSNPSLTVVRFEEGSRVWKFGLFVFAWCNSLKKTNKPNFFPAPGKFFHDVSLDCFSYAGTTDFSSITYFFDSVTTVYVSNSYQPSTFAGQTVTKGTKACGVSTDYFTNPTKTLTPTPKIIPKCSIVLVRLNGPFQQFMFLLIQS